ncbi:hypothetical protein B0H34DRAFT_798529 [Crassisporium funariophilum]|nr:hypothetical protein B0H34DRAFT_798529 [Crassisporium funariophilum]
MPARTRRTAAVAAAALVADMQMDSDVEMDDEQEEQVDIEGDEDVEEVDDDDEADADADIEGDESQSGEEEEEDAPVTAQTQPRLKITLKLPANNAAGSSNSAGTATPDDPELDFPAFKRTPRRRAKTKIIQDIDIESEDPTSPSGSDGAQSAHESPSRSTGTPSTSAKPMTTRQAVLASVVDSSHVSLSRMMTSLYYYSGLTIGYVDEGSRSKKQPLNETELALRREETARKRKNLSEKKLEDEKAETINRLLKKQSRPKNKRTNTIDNQSPMPSASGTRTPKTKAKSQEDGEDAEAEEDEDEAMEIVEQVEEVKPVMYRWVSSLREVPGDGEEKVQMAITFSVPEALFPPLADGVEEKANTTSRQMEDKIRAARGPGTCAVEGCGKPRKYRVPKDWTVGACDSSHLRIVANQV